MSKKQGIFTYVCIQGILVTNSQRLLFVNDRFVDKRETNGKTRVLSPSQTYRLLEKHWRLMQQIYLVYIYIVKKAKKKKKKVQ